MSLLAQRYSHFISSSFIALSPHRRLHCEFPYFYLQVWVNTLFSLFSICFAAHGNESQLKNFLNAPFVFNIPFIYKDVAPLVLLPSLLTRPDFVYRFVFILCLPYKFFTFLHTTGYIPYS